MNNDEYQRAKNAALRLLGLCDRSRKDLKDRLFKKGCPPEVIEAVLSEMESLGYIDDGRFAMRFAVDAMKRKNSGPQAIISGLQKKGVTRDIIEDVVGTIFVDDTVMAVARKALSLKLNKRLKSGCSSLQRDELKRLSDYLRRKGFSYDIIREAIREIATDDDI